jgi:adenosylmethionine-8-amino-7-oxononanoate aminotransferase
MKTFFHGHSYTANPLACAAAIASFEILTSDVCQQNIQLICDSHQHFIAQHSHTKGISNLRSCGTILAFELETNEGSTYFNSMRDKIYDHCLVQNILLRPLGNTIYTMPPYCVEKNDLNNIYEVMLSCTHLK